MTGEREREQERRKLQQVAEEANEPSGAPDLATAAEKHPGREADRTFKGQK